MRKLKVCHVCAALEGATWMVDQLRELRDRFGHDVYAIVVKEDCDFTRRLQAAGIECIVEPFVYNSLKDMVLLPIIVFRMARLFRLKRFDVVQTHLFGAMLVGRIAAWLADVPVRLAMIASPFHLEARISRYVDGSTAWMETGVIASCIRTVELYRQIGVSRRKVSLIYYGPDEQKFALEDSPRTNVRAEHGWNDATPVISLVAYFYPELGKSDWIPRSGWGRAIKGHETLVEAAQLILREIPEARFLLIGRGFTDAGDKYRQKIIDLVGSRGLQREIIFTGHRSDINDILSQTSIAVQAPIVENLGGTVEALLMQRPLVATRVGGIPDIVHDGETGLLVEPDNAAELAGGIIWMLEHPEDAELMAKNGRRLAIERFSLTCTVNDLHRLYQRQAKRRRGYRDLVSSYRRFLAIPVFAYQGFRVVLVEYIIRLYLPIYARLFPRLLMSKAVGLSWRLLAHGSSAVRAVKRNRRSIGTND